MGAKEIHYGTYQFKDAEKSFAAARPNPDLWAGRSVAGNSTRDNTLTITGGNHRDAYGGWTVGTGTTEADQDDSRKNTVSVTGGTLTCNLYGGYTNKAGNA